MKNTLTDLVPINARAILMDPCRYGRDLLEVKCKFERWLADEHHDFPELIDAFRTFAPGGNLNKFMSAETELELIAAVGPCKPRRSERVTRYTP